MGRLMTRKQIAEEYNVSESSIGSWVKAHPSVFEVAKKEKRLTYFNRAKVKRFMENRGNAKSKKPLPKKFKASTVKNNLETAKASLEDAMFFLKEAANWYDKSL